MSDEEWYYSLIDGRVVSADDGVRAADRLGPYPDRESAARALEIARERTEANDRADREWNGPGADPDDD
ncbi:hypothetical protein [Pseudonocardia hydrocarbonoxydans]|uniref:SPOR domain-containing protein n=1 Tax=Pseudonocardia hydrocarbonoxydans TaxID=76726 RepID=A0A4Y3WML0_9PSEU|nr:hypothetical protein [Pseudonocardia hydrocarbonoxydans]GEC20187.1 hypothetical protein PHY01_24700 [Pseudonocardia hydrocarbonoxydans]